MYLLNRDLVFPHPDYSNDYGLLAIGGDLSPQRLELAYYNGIFPWFEDEDQIAWWSPDPRMILYPSEVKVSKSMRKFIRDCNYKLTIDSDFEKVVQNCSIIERKDQDGTWILESMREAYTKLHKSGLAHSIEVWDEENNLIGGLYGVNIGKVFCGESMFSKRSNASKYAFIYLAKLLEQKNYKFIDCQMHTDHLASLGAKEIDRDKFLEDLYSARDEEAWNFKLPDNHIPLHDH